MLQVHQRLLAHLDQTLPGPVEIYDHSKHFSNRKHQHGSSKGLVPTVTAETVAHQDCRQYGDDAVDGNDSGKHTVLNSHPACGLQVDGLV